jgi:hypothetical protein
MGTINETLQLIRRTTTATHSIEVGDMVSGWQKVCMNVLVSNPTNTCNCHSYI